MNMSFYIYKITNNINKKIYIGKSKDPNKRFKRHLYIAMNNIHKNNQFQPIHAAIRKYGYENFSLDIIDQCELESEVFVKEVKYIDYYKSNMTKYYNIGYNLTNGGEGVSGLSPSAQTRKKISLANSKCNNGMFEKTHSEQAKKKMSQFQSQRIRQPLTEEHKRKNREAALKQDFSFRIPIEKKNIIIELWNSKNYTKKQIAEELDIKYNSVVKIIKTFKKDKLSNLSKA